MLRTGGGKGITKNILKDLGLPRPSRGCRADGRECKGGGKVADDVARLGGDEFVLLLAATDENTDEIIRRRVQERFDSCNAQPGRRYELSFSMGIVTTTAETPPALEKLMAQADAAMYKEKQRKKKTATPAIFPG